MRATFHLSADLQVEIHNDPSGAVYLAVYEGVCYDHPIQAHQPLGPEEPIPAGHCSGVRSHRLAATKSQARAIASAMMGCAAEL